VVLNSVVQYFPSIRYLLDVIQGCVRVVAPGGTIYVGDIRSLPLLETFYLSLESFQAPGPLPASQLLDRVRSRIAEEQELVIAPEFFQALRRQFPRISQVSVQPKRGRYWNELSLFRYDAAMEFDSSRKSGEVRWSEWHPGMDLGAIERLVTEAPRLATGIRNVPNARLATETNIIELLSAAPPATVAELRKLTSVQSAPGIDPEDLWDLGKRLSRDVEVWWARRGAPGCVDVVFAEGGGRVAAPADSVAEEAWEAYANDPMRGRLAQKLVPEMRGFLQQRLPDYMLPSAFVLLDALPVNSNGKVERRALPAPDTTRPELERAYVPPRSEMEESMAAVWRDVLGVEQVGVHDNFFELGGDSILTIQIIARAAKAGLHLTPQQLFQHQTIAKLAPVVTTSVVRAEQGPITGPVPLTPIQHWFFEKNLLDSHHFNQAVLFEVGPGLKPEILRKSVEALLSHHDALNMRYEKTAAEWRQASHLPKEPLSVSVVKLPAASGERQRRAIEAAAAQAQASLDLEKGPLLRVVLFDLGPTKPGRLLIIVHHLVVDGVSWRILLEDLGDLYRQTAEGRRPMLPPKTTSYRQWAELLSAYATDPELPQEVAFWTSLAPVKVSPLPTDFRKGRNTAGSVETVRLRLSVDETRALLRDVAAEAHTQINDALLTALLRAVSEWSGSPHLLLDLEGHGRELIFDGVDLSRTVGWFTSIYPVALRLDGRQDPGATLQFVKEQLGCIPHHGIGFGLLRYMSRDREIARRLAAIPKADISFNYLGQFGRAADAARSRFRPAPESSGPFRSPRAVRDHVLEISASVDQGIFEAVWLYSTNLHRRETIERLASSFVTELRALITAAAKPSKASYTPADFAKARVSQKDLDKLLARVAATGGAKA
jgi:non-ribosomal peptide synthase protein (TIGR01720 family)